MIPAASAEVAAAVGPLETGVIVPLLKDDGPACGAAGLAEDNDQMYLCVAFQAIGPLSCHVIGECIVVKAG